MSIKNQIKKEAEKERRKLSQMSRQDKLWYIWEYYKLHIAAVIVIIIFAASIGTTIYNNRFDNALYIMVLNDKSGGESHTDDLSNSLADYLDLGKNEQVMIDNSLFVSYGDNTSEMGYASLAKITALIATKDLDVMIADTASMDHFGALGAYANLKNELPEDLYQLVKDHLYYTTGSDGVSYPCAVSLEDTPFGSISGIKLDPPLLGILSVSEHKDASYGLIRYLFEQS